MSWIERQRYFIDFTLSSLWRRKWRNLSLLFVYTLIVFFISSVIFFGSAIRREAGLLLADAPEMIIQRMVGGRFETIPLSYMDEIRSIRGVKAVRPRLWGYYYHKAARTNYTLMVPESFPHPEDTVQIGAGVLRTWGTVLDNSLYFKAHDGNFLILDIADVFESETELVTSDLILMAEPVFRYISGVPDGYATDIVAEVRNRKECPTVAEKITAMLPDTRVLLREEIQRTYSSLFDWRSGYVIVLLSGAFLAFFIFVWDKAAGLSAEEKHEIGILKALGWDTSDILVMKFWEGLTVSLTAFLLGVLSAYAHVFFTSTPLFAHALKGWAILYPSFRLTPAVNAYELGVLFSLTVMPYTLISIVPSWRTAITDPDTVMR